MSNSTTAPIPLRRVPRWQLLVPAELVWALALGRFRREELALVVALIDLTWPRAVARELAPQPCKLRLAELGRQLGWPRSRVGRALRALHASGVVEVLEIAGEGRCLRLRPDWREWTMPDGSPRYLPGPERSSIERAAWGWGHRIPGRTVQLRRK